MKKLIFLLFSLLIITTVASKVDTRQNDPPGCTVAQSAEVNTLQPAIMPAVMLDAYIYVAIDRQSFTTDKPAIAPLTVREAFHYPDYGRCSLVASNMIYTDILLKAQTPNPYINRIKPTTRHVEV